MKDYTKEEITDLLSEVLPAERTLALVNRWLARGDAVAVYENENLGSGMQGHKQFVSYGSEAAQLIVTGSYDRAARLEWCGPPQRLPDLGGAINWAYRLVGVYRGDSL